MPHDILIVDDELDIRTQLQGIFSDEGYDTRSAANSDETTAAIRDRLPSLVILDIWLQKSQMDGLDLLVAIKRDHPNLPVIMISGHGTIETAVNALKKARMTLLKSPLRLTGC